MLRVIRRLLLWLVAKVDAAILWQERRDGLPRGTVVEIVCPCRTCCSRHARGLWVVLGYREHEVGGDYGWPYLCVRQEFYKPKESVAWHIKNLALAEQKEAFSREMLRPI